MKKLLFEGKIKDFLKISYLQFKEIKRFFVDLEFEENTTHCIKRMIYISGHIKIEIGENYKDSSLIIAANTNFEQGSLTDLYGAISIITDTKYRKYFIKFTSSDSIGNNDVQIYEIK